MGWEAGQTCQDTQDNCVSAGTEWHENACHTLTLRDGGVQLPTGVSLGLTLQNCPLTAFPASVSPSASWFDPKLNGSNGDWDGCGRWKERLSSPGRLQSGWAWRRAAHRGQGQTEMGWGGGAGMMGSRPYLDGGAGGQILEGLLPPQVVRPVLAWGISCLLWSNLAPPRDWISLTSYLSHGLSHPGHGKVPSESSRLEPCCLGPR